MHAISSYRGNRPTNPPTHKQTGPIIIHCAAASAQCNNGNWEKSQPTAEITVITAPVRDFVIFLRQLKTVLPQLQKSIADTTSYWAYQLWRRDVIHRLTFIDRRRDKMRWEPNFCCGGCCCCCSLGRRTWKFAHLVSIAGLRSNVRCTSHLYRLYVVSHVRFFSESTSLNNNTYTQLITIKA